MMLKKTLRLVRHDWPVHFALLFTNWLPDNTVFLRLRGFLVSPFLGSCGRNLRLGRNITFYNPSQIHFGSDVYVAFGCWLMAGEEIKVENGVLFGPYCVIVSSAHSRMGGSFRYGSPIQAAIHIGGGSWLGAHVVVTGGSRIGAGTLVGAGAVVTRDLEDNVMAVGLPARVIGTFNATGELASRDTDSSAIDANA